MPIVGDCRRATVTALPRETRSLSLRHGRLQDRLCAIGTGTVEGSGVHARRHGSCRRRAARNRRFRACRLAGRARGETFRACGAALPIRPFASAGKSTHALGLLPPAEPIRIRHDGSNRGANRTIRAGFSRSHYRAPNCSTSGARTTQRQSRRRRHQWRGGEPRTAFLTTDLPALLNFPQGFVSLLGLNPAGRRRPRNVWLLRSPSRPARPVLASGALSLDLPGSSFRLLFARRQKVRLTLLKLLSVARSGAVSAFCERGRRR